MTTETPTQPDNALAQIIDEGGLSADATKAVIRQAFAPLVESLGNLTRTAPIPVSVKAPAPAVPKAPTAPAKPTRTIVQPGLYPGISFPEYQQIEGVNQSALKDARSPAHIFEALNGEPDDPTAAMVLGSALHARLLEMTTAATLIIDGPINEKTGKPYGVDTNAYRDFAALHPGRIILSGDGRAQLDGMAEAVMRHDLASRLINAAGDTEVSMVWDDPTTGVRCKGRIDKLVRGVLAVDLKTTANASPEAWSRAVEDYGYHIQAEFYRRGMEANDVGGTPFGFLCVENTPPYGVVIYDIEPESMAVAKHHVDRALAMVAACQKVGVWPGYPEEVQQIGIPLWALKRFEEEHQGAES